MKIIDFEKRGNLVRFYLGYPMSRDFNWIESAIRIIQTIVARMSADEEVSRDG